MSLWVLGRESFSPLSSSSKQAEHEDEHDESSSKVVRCSAASGISVGDDGLGPEGLDITGATSKDELSGSLRSSVALTSTLSSNSAGRKMLAIRTLLQKEPQ